MSTKIKDSIQEKLENRKSYSVLSKVNRCLKYSRSGNIPLSYKENTLKEELLLEHVIQYRKEFSLEIDPHRELLLYPLNECDKYKFICTTIRSTKLRYPDLYDYQNCAKFIADFIEFEELNPPNEFPKYIPSPQNVLDWQIGDCFDISIVLCSLLIGSGYNAYVVYGKAPRFITTKDQSNLDCPDLSDDIKIIEPDLSEKDDGIEYEKISDKLPIESKYDKMVELENSKRAEEEKKNNEDYYEDDKPELDRYDPWERKRIHAWVLLKRNKRLPEKDIFIEPTTGRIYDCKNDHIYETIDALFNNFNFYINLSPNVKPFEVDLNFNNKNVWEFVMLNSNDNENDQNEEQTNDNTITQGVNFNKAEEDKLQELLDMPPPWPNKLSIDLFFYNHRTPTNTETFYYKKTKVDKFSPMTQPDGLIMRIYRYTNYARTIIEEIEMRYRNRGDKLYKRIKYPYKNKIIDYYLPGQPWHWKYVEEVESEYRKVVFYPTNLEHCIIYREEHFGKKIIHQYGIRTDRVAERKVLLDKDYTGIAHSYKHFLDNPHYQRRILINKFTQKVNPNSLIPKEQQIYKLSYKFQRGTHIQVIYNLGKDKIFTKPKNFLIDDESSLTNEEKDENHKKVDNDEEIWQKQIYTSKNAFIADFAKIEDFYHKKYEESLRFYKKQYNLKLSETNHDSVKREGDLPILEKNIFDRDYSTDDSQEESSKKYDGDSERFNRLNYYKKIQEERKKDGSYDPIKTKDEIIKIFKEEKMAVTNILQGLLKEQITELNKQMDSFKDDNITNESLAIHNEKINDIQRRINIIYQRSHRHITKIMEDLNELLKGLD